MRPPERDRTEFERIPKYGEPIKGKIVDIAYDKEHKSTWEGKERVRFCVRFRFDLEGCAFPHYSRWLTFSYGEKATLFKKYIKPLVAGAQPDLDLDLDVLKGMEIKTIWSADGEYDNLELIMPLGAKVLPHPLEPIDDEPPPEVAADNIGEDIQF